MIRLTGKIIFLIITLLLLHGCSIYNDDTLGGLAEDDSLEAFYPFNGNAKDESGNGHHGDIIGATFVQDRFGESNKACYFDGSSYYIYIPAIRGFNLSGTHFTISAWVYDNATSADKRIFSLRYDAGNPFLNLYLDNSLLCQFQIYDGGLATVTSVNMVFGSAWYHIAAVWDGKRHRLYINGQFESEISYDIYPLSFTGTADAYIGTTINQTSFHGGYIDDLAIFRRALSADEVKKLYDNTR